MVKRIIVLLIVLSVPLKLFPQLASLKGKVTSASDVPVAGATVTITGTTLGTVADKDGHYSINKIKAGKYNIHVSCIGYETNDRTVEIQGESSAADFVLKETNIDLNEVVVTGTKSEKPIKNVPVLTQVISARKMLELGITNVTDALQDLVPGLNVSQFGTRASVTLQGMDAKYVLFLIDGERIAGEVNGDIDYSMLNFENIDRIEVIKGASSSLYGSNAIGGVVNIITKKMDDPFDAKLYSRYSKYNELYTGGTLGLKKGILGSRTSFTYSSTDGYDLTPESQHDWTQNPYKTFSINQKFEVRPASDLSIVPYATYYQFERANVSARPAHDFYTDLTMGLKGKYFLNNNPIEFSYYHDRYDTYDVLELLGNKKNPVSFDVLQTARVQGNFSLSPSNVLTAGTEFNSEKLFSTRIDNGIKNAGESVVYVQEDLKAGARVNIIAGVRGSYHSTYGFNGSPKISLMYTMGDFKLRTSAGTGFRSPSLKELYMNFDHFGEWYIIGNRDLKPEKSRYVSASAEFSSVFNNSSVTVYSNRLTDMITDRWLPDTVQLTRQYQNIASASVWGVDITTKQMITRNLWFSAGYSLVNSHDNQTGLQLYGTSRHSGSFSLDYNKRKTDRGFSAQLFCKLMGKKFYEITDQGESHDRPFSTWRLTFSQDYKWIRVSAGIDNLFNLIIPQNLDYISPGRRFFVGMNIDFGKIR